jgi:acyl-CoA synthetase (AMP-forming)/AMP-acid ligase II
MDHHNVREALTFTVPSEFGISRKSGHLQYLSTIWTRRTLHRHCRVRLPNAQVPIRFINVADLPRNAVRKVDRHRLDAMVRELAGPGG